MVSPGHLPGDGEGLAHGKVTRGDLPHENSILAHELHVQEERKLKATLFLPDLDRTTCRSIQVVRQWCTGERPLGELEISIPGPHVGDVHGVTQQRESAYCNDYCHYEGGDLEECPEEGSGPELLPSSWFGRLVDDGSLFFERPTPTSKRRHDHEKKQENEECSNPGRNHRESLEDLLCLALACVHDHERDNDEDERGKGSCGEPLPPKPPYRVRHLHLLLLLGGVIGAFA